MKLVNAKVYEDQIKQKMWNIWYDERYQYYFGGSWRCDFSLRDSTESLQRVFAVLNDNDELIGYIGYFVDDCMKVAEHFRAINFSNDKLSFGRAMVRVIKDCFLKFGMEVVEWRVICGNPIERSYDRLCVKFGGRIVGVARHRARDMTGNVCDEKTYEILREDFLNAMQGRRENCGKVFDAYLRLPEKEVTACPKV